MPIQLYVRTCLSLHAGRCRSRLLGSARSTLTRCGSGRRRSPHVTSMPQTLRQVLPHAQGTRALHGTPTDLRVSPLTHKSQTHTQITTKRGACVAKSKSSSLSALLSEEHPSICCPESCCRTAVHVSWFASRAPPNWLHGSRPRTVLCVLSVVCVPWPLPSCSGCTADQEPR